MTTEIEVKFLNINKEDVRSKLSSSGAKLVKPEFLQKRKTFDFPHYNLKPGEYKWLRVRDEGDKITMTMKHLIEEDRIDNTKELEIKVDSFEKACEMLEEMEWTVTNYQETLRERWEMDNVEITIDTWPTIEPFVEIEGPSEQKVREISEKLEFDYSTALFGTVDFIYAKVHTIDPDQMKSIKILTFDNLAEVKKQLNQLKSTA